MAIENKYEHNKNKRFWLDDKQGMFSASNIHLLLSSKPTDSELNKDSTLKFGKGAITYIKKVAMQCLTKVEDDEFGGGIVQMENGRRYEGIAIDTFFDHFFKNHKELSLVKFGEGNPKFHTYNDYSGCSPDAVIKLDVLPYAIVEAKRPTNETQMETLIELHKKSKKIQEIQGIKDYNKARQIALKEWNYKYYCQVQFQMMCLKVDKAFWISFNDNMKAVKAWLIVLPIEPDLDVQKNIKIKLIEANAVKNKIITDYNNALNLI